MNKYKQILNGNKNVDDKKNYRNKTLEEYLSYKKKLLNILNKNIDKFNFPGK